jgi:hypothetical protein
MLLRLKPVGPGYSPAGSGRGGRWGLKQGAWRSFLARQRKNVPTHFHRPPAPLSRPSAVGHLNPGINQSPVTGLGLAERLSRTPLHHLGSIAEKKCSGDPRTSFLRA